MYRRSLDSICRVSFSRDFSWRHPMHIFNTILICFNQKPERMQTENQKLRNSYEEGQMDELHKLAGWHPDVWTSNDKLEKPPLDQPLLRGRISSDINDMDELHRLYGWTPDRTMIRPTPESIERKAEYLECVRNEYNSHEDYILQQVFGKAPIKNQDGRYEIPNKESIQKMKRFERNQFAYNLPEGTRHFVMWYTYWPPEVTEDEINQDIANAIVKRLGNCEYEFVWYENPKMTIPGIYHVQVFWRVRK